MESESNKWFRDKWNKFEKSKYIEDNWFDKFNDRMNRKEDLAVIDKINTIDIFYKKKRINIINLFVCLYTIYYWSIDTFLTLKKQKKITIANNFFEAIKKYDRKLLMHLAMKYALLKTFISKLKKYV